MLEEGKNLTAEESKSTLIFSFNIFHINNTFIKVSFHNSNGDTLSTKLTKSFKLIMIVNILYLNMWFTTEQALRKQKKEEMKLAKQRMAE